MRTTLRCLGSSAALLLMTCSGVFAQDSAAQTQELSFVHALRLDPPPSAKASTMRLFGQFVGDWVADVSLFKPDGTQVLGKAEWRWRWILDGTALQDVYTLHSVGKPRESRIIGSGTAIRFLDPGTAQWRVVYISPSRGYLFTFNARENGDQILLEGVDETGALMRWVFSEIKPQTFRWRALVSPDGGKSWEKRQEMLVQRAVP